MKELVKDIVGGFLVSVRPAKAVKLSKTGITLTDELNLEERLMRHALLKRAERGNDHDGLQNMHKEYWVKKGDGFFSRNTDRFQTLFKPHSGPVIQGLREQLEKTSEPYRSLVEIGTGNGHLLNYLSVKFPRIERFIGIDLSPDQIKSVKKKYEGNDRLEFVAADGFEWVRDHGEANTIFVTFGGVLEYFAQKRLEAFFRTVNRLENVLFLTMEPNAADHNFRIHPDSRPYGHESSFSHNYPLLFKKAGFQVWHESTMFHVKGSHYFSVTGACS